MKNVPRPPLEHQLSLKGLLEDAEAFSGSHLSLRLASAVLRERQDSEQKLEEKLGTEGDAEGEDEWSDDMETECNDNDDKNQKVIYTKNNGQKMVF